MRQWMRIVVGLLVVGCGTASPPGATTRPTPTDFPIEAFAAIREDPVSADLAAKLQSVLAIVAGEAGASATIMSPVGTWSGAIGKADGARDVTINDQFSIASTTKAVTAAQVMQLVEAGKLGLDDPVADHLPRDIDFDTNGATVRDLLSHRSGIPDYQNRLVPAWLSEPRRAWTPAEVLAEVPTNRTPPGGESEYANVNYLLLGLVIEETTGRPMAKALRDGVLGIDGVERLIYQPDEVPTEPIAIDNGSSHKVLENMGGFLPSLAFTSDGAAAAMASDSISLARWWRALCAGEIVSQASLTAMAPRDDWYGLGLAEFDPPGTVGHYGQDSGGVSMAGCMPERGVVFALLANRNGSVVNEGSPGYLVDALR